MLIGTLMSKVAYYFIGQVVIRGLSIVTKISITVQTWSELKCLLDILFMVHFVEVLKLKF